MDELHQERVPDLCRRADGPARDQDYWNGLFADEGVGVLIADAEGSAVGFVQVRVRDTPDVPMVVPRRFSILENIVVDEGHRRQGVEST
jgi:ribosomal protein S18 acetylase RimI-like enzyme